LAGSGSKLVGLFGSVFSLTTAAVEQAAVELTLVEVMVEVEVMVLAEVFAEAGACGRLFCGFVNVVVCDFIFSSILSSSSTRGSNVLCFIP